MAYSKTYLEYLGSSLWRERRLAKLEQADFRCQVCKENKYLQVHHLTYERLEDEDTNNLIVLCPACHAAANYLRKHPNTPLCQLAKKIKAKLPALPKRTKHTRKDRRKRNRRLKARRGNGL